MASFELRCSSCDGHIRALAKAIQMASRVSKDALLEFTPNRMRICAKTSYVLVKFVFTKDFFTEYECNTRHKCYIMLKALLMPFRSSVLVSDRDTNLRSQIRIKCSVEDEMNSRIVFKIGSDLNSASLTYRLVINDLDPERMEDLNAINRTIDYARVEISPQQVRKERFLLSAFNSFAPDIDQVTIKTSQSEVKFTGSISPATTLHLRCKDFATSEFTHKREDFSTFLVKEDLTITVPLKILKAFLGFVEVSRVHTNARYIFEGMGSPAHFIYDAHLFKGHFVSATPFESYIQELENHEPLPIENGPNESFIADENVIQADDGNYENATFDHYLDNDDEDLDEEDGYNDNQSDASDLLDGNLEALNRTSAPEGSNISLNQLFASNNKISHENNSMVERESIRTEMRCETSYDPERVKELLNLDQDPEEIENLVIQYSSDSEDE